MGVVRTCECGAQDTESFRWWAKTVSASAQLGEQLPQYSEYWTAIGVVLADERKPKQAIGALVRALEIDGTDFRAVNRMIRMVELLQMPEQVEWWENRWREYREILRDSNLVAANPTPDTQSMKSLSSRLASNGRSLELLSGDTCPIITLQHQKTFPNGMRRGNVWLRGKKDSSS